MASFDTAIGNATPRQGSQAVRRAGVVSGSCPQRGQVVEAQVSPRGKERRPSLGVYPDVSLKQARERRDEARKLVADGIDPSQSGFRSPPQATAAGAPAGCEGGSAGKPQYSGAMADAGAPNQNNTEQQGCMRRLCLFCAGGSMGRTEAHRFCFWRTPSVHPSRPSPPGRNRPDRASPELTTLVWSGGAAAAPLPLPVSGLRRISPASFVHPSGCMAHPAVLIVAGMGRGGAFGSDGAAVLRSAVETLS